jgi:hypothetical protein
VSTPAINRRRIAVAGGTALVALSMFIAGCGKGGESSTTSTTTTTTTTSATPSPTEKGVSPTGPNLFTPGVTAPGAPTVQGGQHPGINGVP